jgi:hypothetical protein
MVPFSNKRRHRRFCVDVMDIKGKAVFASEAVINDISITGASLITDRKLDMGREYSLRILDSNMELPIQGTVIWCVENESAGIQNEHAHLKYSAGLQFSGLQEETAAKLITFIEHHLIDGNRQAKVHDTSGLRCNIRFHVDTKETAVLNIAETYRVKKLSLGGLLIESSHSLESDTRIHMGISIPEGMQLSFTGRVAFCIVSPDNPSHFEVGIEFIELPEPDRAMFKVFIRRFYLEGADSSAERKLPDAKQ